jgi:DNA-binding beta-propeller fold protein YncE
VRKLLKYFAIFPFVLCLQGAIHKATFAQTSFGPETFTLTSGKANITRNFSVSNTAVPYTLTLANGSDRQNRIKKGKVILNGKEILSKKVFSSRFARLVVAISPAQQNELVISLKGQEGSFATISVEPTPNALLNDPSSQQGIGYPYCVTVDQSTHRAYVTDRHLDSILEFDVAQAQITRSFSGIDGDQTIGNGATAGAHFNSSARTIVAVNEGTTNDPMGSLAVLNPATGSINVTPLTDAGNSLNPVYVAVNANSNVAAFNARYDSRGRRAYFFDIASGAISSRGENMTLTGVAVNEMTNQFVFTGADSASAPALFLYSAFAPFQRVKKIDSTAQAGTNFERIAVNPATNIAVAVNQRDGAVFLFDLASGNQTARIPINVNDVGEPSADVAINPETNLAVVVSRYTPRVSVISLTTKLVMAELLLPEGARPLGIGIDNQSNRAVISENGLSSTERNGSLLVFQLPAP